MKKIVSLIVIMFLFMANPYQGQACTNFLISKGASKDGSTMITYAADSHVLYGELYSPEAADYLPGGRLDVY